MNIKFVFFVVVILWENLTKATSNHNEKAIMQHLLARRQIDDIDKKNGSSNKKIDLLSSLNVSTNTIKKRIDQEFEKTINKTDKLAKSIKRKVIWIAKRQQRDFTKLIKSSRVQLQSLKTKLLKAQEITQENTKDLKELVELSVDKLKDLFKTTCTYFKELGKSYRTHITNYGNEIENNSTMDLPEIQINEYTKASDENICNTTQSITHLLKELFKFIKIKIKNVDSSIRQCVLELATTTKKKYQVISSSNKALQLYINTMNIRIGKIAKNTTDMFEEYVRKCLGKFSTLTNYCEESLKKISIVYGKIGIAAGNKDNEQLNKLKDQEFKIGTEFDDKLSYLCTEIDKEGIEQSNTIFNSTEKEIRALQDCSTTQLCNFPKS